MRKKIVVVILSVAMLLSCGAIFVACNKTGAGSDLILTGGSRPQYDSLFSADVKALIDGALTDIGEDATEEEKAQAEERKKRAVIALFDAANYSRKNTPLSLMLQQSNAGIALGDVVMHGFNLKVGNAWYYQLATQVSTGSDLLDAIMSAFAGFLKVAYTEGDGNFWYSMVMGTASECDCTVKTFPYASFKLTQEPQLYDEESFQEELHYLDSMHEINNMQFCAEIIADGAKISYDEERGFYTVEFSVDMSADPELITEWYAMAQKDMQVSGNSINKYNYYNAVLEVWDNGYAKSFKSESSRDAGMASGDPVDEFTYLWVEREIMDLLHEDASIDLSAFMHTPAEFVEYYSNPSTVAAQMNQSLVGIIVVGVLIGVIIIGGITAIIVVNVLVKKGKLPKLAAKREARKQKRLAKKNKLQTEENADNSEDNLSSENIETDEHEDI